MTCSCCGLEPDHVDRRIIHSSYSARGQAIAEFEMILIFCDGDKLLEEVKHISPSWTRLCRLQLPPKRPSILPNPIRVTLQKYARFKAYFPDFRVTCFQHYYFRHMLLLESAELLSSLEPVQSSLLGFLSNSN
jgi:hypothetical protein